MPHSMREFLPPLLLVVEDNDEDFELLERVVEQTAILCRLDRCISGEEAMAYLLQNQSSNIRPSLILLDLSLPGTDGQEILDRIKQTDGLQITPIVVLSGNLNQKEVNSLYQRGISGYIVKQVDSVKLKRNMQLVIEYWLIANRLPI